MRSWRENPTYAHVLPLAACMIVTSATASFKIKNPELPLLRQVPELIGLPIQIILSLGLLWYFCQQYPWRPVCGLSWAVVAGVIGITLWLVPGWIFEHWHLTDSPYKKWLAWLGCTARLDGFDPTVVAEHPLLYPYLLTMRFLRLVVVVPLVEEIFWRSYLMRVVSHPDEDFQTQPMGQHSWRVFAIVTLAFMLIHNTDDWLVALIYGSLTYLLFIKTKSLPTCVVMHGVANLLLGLYVMWTKQWGYW